MQKEKLMDKIVVGMLENEWHIFLFNENESEGGFSEKMETNRRYCCE